MLLPGSKYSEAEMKYKEAAKYWIGATGEERGSLDPKFPDALPIGAGPPEHPLCWAGFISSQVL